MKLPLAPPSLETLARNLSEAPWGSQTLVDILKTGLGLEQDGRYLHWDRLRHLDPPTGFTTEEWWFGIASARRSSRKKLPFVDKGGRDFGYCVTDTLWQQLHIIDQRASGAIEVPEPVANEDTRDRYMVSSLIEEAITSSQLEGASTTLRDAKQMLRSGRKPADRSERMIFNNYRAMQFIREIRDESLTPQLVQELQRVITEDALDYPDTAGRWRRDDEPITVCDNRDGTTLHVPPAARELDERVAKLCRFANQESDASFVHPVIRAIILHFMLAYDHPFADGNGRTARALYYWSMAGQRYWLIEFVSISRLIVKAPAQYARAFLHTETDDNDVTYFLLHQCDIIVRALDALHRYLRRKVSEQRRIQELLSGPDSLRELFNHRQLALLSHAQRHPLATYTIESHRRSHNVTYQTARTDLLGLAEAGLLEQKKRGKAFVFFAPQDLELQVRELQRNPKS